MENLQQLGIKLQIHVAQRQAQNETHVVHRHRVVPLFAINHKFAARAVVHPFLHVIEHVVVEMVVKYQQSEIDGFSVLIKLKCNRDGNILWALELNEKAP